MLDTSQHKYVMLAQTISSKYYVLLFPLNLIITIVVILLVYSTVCSDVISIEPS